MQILEKKFNCFLTQAQSSLLVKVFWMLGRFSMRSQYKNQKNLNISLHFILELVLTKNVIRVQTFSIRAAIWNRLQLSRSKMHRSKKEPPAKERPAKERPASESRKNAAFVIKKEPSSISLNVIMKHNSVSK